MDDELRILSRVGIPTALSALDDRIIHALGVRRHEAAAMRRVMALSAFISLGGGIIAGSAVSQPAVAAGPPSPLGERQSVESGKSVSVRVDLGGRRNIRDKKTETDTGTYVYKSDNNM